MQNSFVNAVKTEANKGLTANGALTYKSSLDRNVDLFFIIGNRNKDFSQEFRAAYQENPELATRILLWARDPRGGAGERQTFRTILQFLEKHDFRQFSRILPHVPRLGRWDDVLCASTAQGQILAAALVKRALDSGDKLCAKWMPREHSSNSFKRRQAKVLAKHMGLSPRQYRKLLSRVSNTVEQKMCAKDWVGIDYSTVPSLAAARYQKAFLKNDEERYSAHSAELAEPESSAKINAGAVYPYDIIKSLRASSDERTKKVAVAQWEALPNYVGSSKALPMVDVSRSMNRLVGGNPNLNCMDVALSLGLYLADKNSGAFKDTFLTFSSKPELLHLEGDIQTKMHQMKASNWRMSTDIAAAFSEVLRTAVENRVPQKDMPEFLIILSDMEFNHCVRKGQNVSAYVYAERRFEAAGYKLPQVVFWNLNSRPGNCPVRAGTMGTALISGFSPGIMQSVLAGDLTDFTPRGIMLKTVMNDKYEI